MKIELGRDWNEFLSLLIARRVRFVLVGGHAVAGHGEPRLTEDLDVFVEPTLANAGRLRPALADFGFGDVAPTAAELATKDRIFMLGRKPWRIDVLTGIDGVTFAEAWDGRVEADFVAKPLSSWAERHSFETSAPRDEARICSTSRCWSGAPPPASEQGPANGRVIRRSTRGPSRTRSAACAGR